MKRIKTVEWKNNSVVMIDQRLLPRKEVYNVYTDYRQVAQAIERMVVRGAPAIGVSAAMGMALGALAIRTDRMETFHKRFETIAARFATTRPTAINLFWAIDRMKRVADRNANLSVAALKKTLVKEAKDMHAEDIDINRRMGRNGARLIKSGSTVLTHCNAGALATAGYGTALGIIRAAVEAGKRIRVVADETRPFLQGTRLTAWELKKDRIDVTLITDNMAGHLMKKGLIDTVVVGTDRVAANGDVANKIGTYTVAVLARKHNIPFYVAAPCSTIDLNVKHGDDIPIEQRDPSEVTHIGGVRLAPKGIKVLNPAFDVTPAALVSAIVTERGVVRAPYKSSIKKLFTRKKG